MKSPMDLLFAKYFQITDDKFEISEPAKVSDEMPGTRGTEQEDLITLISKVMVENERLQDIRTELESKVESPEEMENFMKKMLPILDGFERILDLAHEYPPSKELDNWFKSMETVYFRFLTLLEKYGLKALDTIGKPVNLNCHDVVEYRATLNYQPDIVISERQKGYYFNNKLIRDAKVVVAYNPT